VPYDETYPTCERTVAELRIYGADLDPAYVTTQLGMPATSSQKRGETGTNSLGLKRTAKSGGWFLSSEHVESKDLRHHLDWLLAQLSPRSAALRSLQATEGITMNVTCIWWSAAGDGGPSLWPEQMSELASLNLECAFECAFYGTNENSS
jgi:hypothetical protein